MKDASEKLFSGSYFFWGYLDFSASTGTFVHWYGDRNYPLWGYYYTYYWYGVGYLY